VQGLKMNLKFFLACLCVMLMASTSVAQEVQTDDAVQSEPDAGSESATEADEEPLPRPPAGFGEPSDENEDGALEYSGAILFNVGGLLWYSIFYRTLVLEPEFQYAFSEYVGIDIMPRFQYFFGTRTDVRQMGGGGALGLRIMPMGTGLEGLFIVPRVLLNYLDGKLRDTQDDNGVTVTGDEYKTTIIAPNAEVGYSWIWGGLIMNVGGLVGYNIVASGDDVFEDRVLGHWRLQINASLGYAF